MNIYLVLDDSKDCYDCSDRFMEAFMTREEADNYIMRYSPSDREDLKVEEYTIG